MNYLKSRSDSPRDLPRSSFIKPRIFIEALPSQEPSDINLCCEVLPEEKISDDPQSAEKEALLIEELRHILYDPLSLDDMSNML